MHRTLPVKTATDKVAVDFVVNMAFHKIKDREENWALLIHELAHNVVRSNDHLCEEFYEEVTKLGVKLAVLALGQPELFHGRVTDVTGKTNGKGAEGVGA